VMGSNEYFVETLDGNTLHVGGNGPGNYTTIQDAVDASIGGDTIYVYNGIYHEMVVIDKSLNLLGEDRTLTIIDGQKGEFLKDDVILVTADRVNISGFTITNSSVGCSYDAGIALKSADNCVITDNIFKENDWGMEIRKSHHNTINNNIISSCSGGIHLCFSDNNLVSDCTIEQGELRGVSVYDSRGNTIISNTFTECGIEIYTSPHGTKNHNTIIENTVNGKPLAYLENEADKIIEDAGQVILINCEDVTIRNLDLSHTSTGIQVRHSRNITINENVLSYNAHGISVVESQYVTIEDNIINDNRGAGVGIYHTFAEKNEILNNIIINNGKGIYIWNCLSGETIIKNNEVSNNEGGLEICSRSCIISRNNICENSEYGVEIQLSGGKLIYENNFEQNGANAYFEYHREIGVNRWSLSGEGNYWADWDGTGPYVIRGKLIVILIGPGIGIPWLNFDWHPASEPYDIGGK
ncbi:MAG: right-handed parallel beta-helix repeat-containing protein, partial [Bacteroidales bacterium]|nr:right-handed parallel beta-helix repeat-containing protein [Bacteroidales bacterium]